MQHSNLVSINPERCDSIAQRIRRLNLPSPTELPGGNSKTRFDLANVNLILVAICHQTQKLKGTFNGVERRGWDYLRLAFLEWATQDADRATPSQFCRIQGNEIRNILSCAGQLSDSDLEHRASLVRNCGEVLLSRSFKSVSDVFEECGRRIKHGTPNLLEWLNNFDAFKDPVQKKSLYFLGLNHAECGWRFIDPEALLPPVDYHEVRGHLRLGTVVICDEELRAAISMHQRVDQASDIAIRSGVTEAICRISSVSNRPPMQLHYAFWNIFRAVCLRGKPICRGGLELVAEEYRNQIEGKDCPFVACCDSADSEKAVDEHLFETDWY